jgi:hypothetical protein
MGMLVTRGECQRSERRADLLLCAWMWLSLTEPIKDDLQGAYELPSQRPIGLTQRHSLSQSLGRHPSRRNGQGSSRYELRSGVGLENLTAA